MDGTTFAVSTTVGGTTIDGRRIVLRFSAVIVSSVCGLLFFVF